MSQKHISAILILSVIIPLLCATCVLIILLMVLPNVSDGGGAMGAPDNKPHPGGQMSAPPSSQLVFILGIVFVSILFVLLVVIVLVVCNWARKDQGYVVSDSPAGVRGLDCRLTKHSQHRNWAIEKDQSGNHSINSISEAKIQSTFVATLPNPDVKTVPVTAQFPAKNICEGDGNSDPYQIIDNITCQDPEATQRQSYGSLCRTHLLRSVDDDGYHFDKFGIDNDALVKEDFLPSFDEVESPVKLFPESTHKEEPEHMPTETKDSAEALSTEEDLAQDKHFESQLVKQDSFQGLPPFKSFDKYLTLVRLDSATSLDSYTLEDTKKRWSSIEEESEIEMVDDKLQKTDE